MAYGNYLASVSPEQVRSLRQDLRRKLIPGKIVCITNLTAFWIKKEPLGGLLNQAIDHGETLSAELWHPYRVPVYHDPSRTSSLFRLLSAAWQEALTGEPFRERDLFRTDIEKLLSVFEYATQESDGVVSVLDPPFDADRANRVHIPFDIPDA